MLLPLLAIAIAQGGLGARVDAVARQYLRDDRFSGCIVVGREGRILFQRAYGSASKELKAAHTLDTKFRFHSVSKNLTAVAVMRLVEAGQLKTSESIRTYLPELPESWSRITLRHLLTHTSGLPLKDNDWANAFENSNLNTVRSESKNWADKELTGQPPAPWAYNNVNYELLAAAAEKVTGKTFPEAMRELVFEPCGMRNSVISSPSGDPNYGGATFVPGLATGYNGKPGGPTVSVCYSYLIMGSGGVLGTAGDLFRFASAVYGSKLLKPESVKEILDGVEPGAGRKSRYGYGIVITEAEGRRLVKHDGGNNGFMANMDIFPDDQTVIVVLSNLGYTDYKLISDLRKAVYAAPSRVSSS